jgi:quercetin dioxygenase-like cupin family protein
VYQEIDVQEESKMLSYLPDPCPSLQVPVEISPGSVSPWHGHHREREVFAIILN